MQALQSRKVAGPNGLPAEMFKCVAGKLAPHLFNMFLAAIKAGQLPEDTRMATIVVLVKKGKPHDLCSSYRPISLLNFEVKVLAKIIANWLSPVIQSLIHPDQSGFMPHRSTRLNLRRLYGVMHMTQTQPDVPAGPLSLDARMAFDSIEWAYLLAVLEKVGLGPNLQKWIRLLYTALLAWVRVNGVVSRAFALHRGTRQGCPLSPMLFALALEPLAAWIRRDPMVKGIDVGGGWEERISLYADDILLYAHRPRHTFHRLIHIIQSFGSYSGYCINWDKSLVFSLTGDPPVITSACSELVQKDKFTYLGIWVTKSVEEFTQLNLLVQLKTIG